MLCYILCVIIFYAFWYFDGFWLFFSIWCNRCRKKSLEFVLGLLVTKAFLGRCCGVAAVSKKLFKAPETVFILYQICIFKVASVGIFGVAWYVVTRRGVIKWWFRFCKFGFIVPDVMWTSDGGSVNKWWFLSCFLWFIYWRAAPAEK